MYPKVGHYSKFLVSMVPKSISLDDFGQPLWVGQGGGVTKIDT